jgi:hypothetical protein
MIRNPSATSQRVMRVAHARNFVSTHIAPKVSAWTRTRIVTGRRPLEPFR